MTENARDVKISSSKFGWSDLGVAGVERQRTPGRSAIWGLTSFDPSHPPPQFGTTEDR